MILIPGKCPICLQDVGVENDVVLRGRLATLMENMFEQWVGEMKTVVDEMVADGKITELSEPIICGEDIIL